MSDVKAQMQDKDRMDLHDHVLCLSGKPLDNGRTLSECNVRPQSSLELLPRLRGGMQLEITTHFGDNIIVKASDTHVHVYSKFLCQKPAITSPVSH